MLSDLPIALYLLDREGRVIYFNAEAVRFVGQEPRIGHDMWCVTWRLWERNGRRLPHDQCPMAVAMKKERRFAARAPLPKGRTVRARRSRRFLGGFNGLSPLAA
ncbi:hypothetical protein [Candidatus Viadribacter manganicus]|uniref:PAS domain-containing protein n=1 Tax=Candidatus Viadribacter manganicus TaxID=1759059 RepID=A0A1B1AIY9_9PROT|nr:hypothetical protein [Candidatus Viadribacter manganicus]ANP46522.1 hypothetical protein ATE48_11630 [Candidatus Viadribacter manganicus]